MKIQNLFLVVVFQLLVYSCTSKEKIVKLQFSEKNPSEYVFSISKDSIYNILRTKFSFNNMYIWDSVENPTTFRMYARDMLENRSKINFIFEFVGEDYFSKGYLKSNGDSLYLQGKYYVFFEIVSERKTKISIKSNNLRLIVGKELLPTPPHMVRKTKYVKVESSTIEEYEILLAIGGLINEHRMPKIIQPNAQSKKEHK